MEIILAKSAGFCFGVKNAVKTAYEKAESEDKLYTYGPIIHNKVVTDDLANRGVKVIDTLDEPIDGKIIIRSHGVPPDVYKKLEEKGLEYFDCTCPFVKKIHHIVEERHKAGMQVIIIGNAVHPEVVGINGWCGNTAVIINSAEEARAFVPKDGAEYAVVSQTTFQTDIFDEIIEILSSKTKIKLDRTICLATAERQNEAVEIAKQVECMIILGDTKSSNTRKLYEISKKYCKNTFLFETIVDLDLKSVLKYGKIGITAGASTPPAIIKEAVETMSENENKSFEEMLDESMVTLRSGDIVKGTVISVSPETGDVSVNLGFKSDGIISRSDFSDDPNANPADSVKAGDVIDVYVVRVNDGDGYVQLSKKKVDANKGYEDIEKAFNDGTSIKGKVIEQVKGGLIALINGIRVFVPSSQISNRYVEDLKAFVGQELDFNILEYNSANRRKIVAGRKALAQKEIDEKRKEVFDAIKVGDRIDGTVSRIVDFGAFVDLGCVDGLIHISEMSWGRIKRVSDVLKEGDKVKVTVLDINSEKGKISLSLKDLDADPWKTAETKYAVGNVVSGKVVRMVPFGAFVELEEGIDGLVHISQIAYEHVEKPEDVLTAGQEISAKVTELDLENKKISLSIKETLPKPEKAEESAPAAEAEE